ncbi:TPA: helix-turn-helix transcriptional regulator, partial [Bacillus cytotoxicus]|nr:helix-turn-helix transcriptional regulator [Bacillus cytotoxicus]
IFKNIYQKISVKQLARMVNMNPNYLSILFKEEVGISLNEYIQRERVEEAKKLLTLTDYSLSDICAWLNFSDQSYFTKVFKKFTNKTPGKYRKHFTII